MFHVKGLRKDVECGGCDKTADCYDVVCDKKTIEGPLCQKCFYKQVKMRVAANGQPAKPDLFHEKAG